MALPELVRDGINGFLVPPHDPKAMAEAVLQIVRDSELSKRMRQASLSIASPHEETHTFDQYEDLYRQMLTREGEAPSRPSWPDSEKQVAR
jgi:glycosyltransferase involved in cell wall biosynthesis